MLLLYSQDWYYRPWLVGNRLTICTIWRILWSLDAFAEIGLEEQVSKLFPSKHIDEKICRRIDDGENIGYADHRFYEIGSLTRRQWRLLI